MDQRQRKANLAAEASQNTLISSFEQQVKEKEAKKQARQDAERAREFEREKKRRELEAFQQEINAICDSDEDTAPKPKVVEKCYAVPIAINSVKGRWNKVEEDRKRAEDERAKILKAAHQITKGSSSANILTKCQIFSNERKQRMAKDAKDKKKLQKEELEKELALVEAGESSRRRESKSSSSAAKPKKLQISEDDLIKRAEEDRLRKLRIEREKREAEDRERIKSEREKLQNEDLSEIMEENTEKQAPVIKKLNLSMTDLERQRDEQFKKRAEEERRRREEADKNLFEAERARLAAEEADDSENAPKKQEKMPVKVGKIQLDYDKIVSESNKAKELELEGEMKDRMQQFRNLRQQSKTFQEEDFKQPELRIC